MSDRRFDVRALCRLALLTGIALMLSYLEALLPPIVPLPGVKLGLANLVTLFLLYRMGVAEAALTLTARILLSSILFATPVTALYSLGGGACALLIMAVCHRCGRFSPPGVSIAGAAAHQIGQLAVAALLLRSLAVFSYLTPLLLVSLFTGLLNGVLFLLVRNVPLSSDGR